MLVHFCNHELEGHSSHHSKHMHDRFCKFLRCVLTATICSGGCCVEGIQSRTDSQLSIFVLFELKDVDDNNNCSSFCTCGTMVLKNFYNDEFISTRTKSFLGLKLNKAVLATYSALRMLIQIESLVYGQ